MKKFVTIFPICENVHLTKDVGQIPYFLHHLYNYDSKIVCYRNQDNYKNIDTEVKGLKIEFIEKTGRISFAEKSIINYLIKYSKKIDILNLYSFSKFSFLYGVIYKIINPKGILFLKIDGYNTTFEDSQKIKYSNNKIKNFIIQKLENIFLKKVDLMAMENTFGVELVKNKFPKYTSKIIYLPVGVNDVFVSNNFKNKFNLFHQKENIILTVGRIGAAVKNNEMILNAIAQVDLKNWRMVFIGTVTEDFKKHYDTWAKKNPHQKNKIIFTGEITNRIDLYEWYNKSKIFCMTSWNESFCCSLAEASYFGNYLIGTEGIVSMNDLTNHEKYGVIINANDDVTMAFQLQNIINNSETIAKNHENLVKHSHENFSWSKIISNLNRHFEKQ